MNHPLPRHRHAQRGATLIITLVMLTLITLVCVSTIRSTTIDEKMAGNTRDRDRALQAAEGVIRQCLAKVRNSTYTGPTLTPVTAPGLQNWEVDANWSNTNSIVASPTIDSTLASQPRCMVEALGAGTGSYRVTGRAVGGSSLTVVILQATYTTQ
jgi:type IV pilus assembly protein PilX